jgi:hypothetical protein
MAYSFNVGFPEPVMLAIYKLLNATSWKVFLSCKNHQHAAKAGLNCAPCNLCTLDDKDDDDDKDADEEHSSCFFTLREEGDALNTGYRVYIIRHQAPALASPPAPAVQVGPGGTVRLTFLGSSRDFAFVGRATPPRAQTEGHSLASRRERTKIKDRERGEFDASRRPTKKRKADSDDEEDEEEGDEEEGDEEEGDEEEEEDEGGEEED